MAPTRTYPSAPCRSASERKADLAASEAGTQIVEYAPWLTVSLSPESVDRMGEENASAKYDQTNKRGLK
jgi:hypothetical protein